MRACVCPCVCVYVYVYVYLCARACARVCVCRPTPAGPPPPQAACCACVPRMPASCPCRAGESTGMRKTEAARHMAALPGDEREERLTDAAQWRVLHPAGSEATKRELSELPEEVQLITVFQNPVPNSKRGAVIRSKVGGNSFQANYRPPSGRITAHLRANYRPPSRGDSRGVAVAPIGAAGYNPGLWSDLPTIIRAPPASPTASAVRQHSPDVLGPAARRRAWCAY